MNNCRILFGAQFRRLFNIEISQPILTVDDAFHPADISNSVSHVFTISNIKGLGYSLCRLREAADP